MWFGPIMPEVDVIIGNEWKWTEDAAGFVLRTKLGCGGVSFCGSPVSKARPGARALQSVVINTAHPTGVASRQISSNSLFRVLGHSLSNPWTQ